MKELLNKFRWLGFTPIKTEALIEVVDVLTTIKESQSEVSVLFDGADESYSSRIGAINARHRILVIDSAPSEIALPPLNRGRQLTVSSPEQGPQFSFQTRFLEPFLPDVSMGYQIEMPSVLSMQHHRSAFRVLLDELRHKVGITLEQPSSDPITGIVENISKSGVGMKTKYELPVALKSDSSMVDCHIALMDSEEISCKMEIRNVRHQSNGDTNTYVGGRMLDISRKDSNLLTEFIEHLQNQQLKAIIN